ncbi:hypothetical protein [Nocardioides bruguierae]|uniref:Uncharacterized protein n=1 Tax=Nocardioides bruguierae TaxID=2945102 RepID=A0A9X2D5R5_9ACTN|nr:hypothetical protein [Nocardioides bruguierae]MCM0619828.1 hypothetical protein [Nocardioides bruguierae]
MTRERMDEGATTILDGIPVHTPDRAVGWAARYAATLTEAVVLVDMALAADLVTLDDLVLWCALHPSWTGIEQARQALLVSDENSWSPQETRLRLRWLDARPSARLVTNRPVFDRAGRHVATPDLLDLDAGVAGEYDGDSHLDRGRRAGDLARLARMRSLGLEVETFVAGDLAARGPIVGRLGAAYARAIRSGVRREWTVTPPPGWTSTSTVEERRALTASQQQRFLGYRRAA